MMPDPIRIPCEGAGCRVLPFAQVSGLCPMCGRHVASDQAGDALPHERDDVLAMLTRGDYG